MEPGHLLHSALTRPSSANARRLRSKHPFVSAAQQLISLSDNNIIRAACWVDHQWNVKWADNPTPASTPGNDPPTPIVADCQNFLWRTEDFLKREALFRHNHKITVQSSFALSIRDGFRQQQSPPHHRHWLARNENVSLRSMGVRRRGQNGRPQGGKRVNYRCIPGYCCQWRAFLTVALR